MSRHVVGEKLSIGKPTPNNTVYILDDKMEPVPVGAPGTMWAGGHGISRGYVGLDEKTRETFLPDKFANDGYGSMMHLEEFHQRRWKSSFADRSFLFLQIHDVHDR